MITNVVDLSVLNKVADLLGTSPDKIKPVYDQMRINRVASAPLQTLNFACPCLLLGSFYRSTADIGTALSQINQYFKFLFGAENDSFDLAYDRPFVASYEKEIPIIFDNILFSQNGTTPFSLFISFVRFELL